jgi:GMP synthase-like glutamine amidotransferase
VLDADVRSVPSDAVGAPSAEALVLSGSFDPWALHSRQSLDRLDEALRRYPGPVLGICAGMQTLVRACGGLVGPAEAPVRGFEPVDVIEPSGLLDGLGSRFSVFQDHSDEVTALPPSFRVLATSGAGTIEAIAAEDRPWWGTQFHPEAWDDEHPAGRRVLERFAELAGL